ncbi:hypothetical protein C9374_003791 [Naegleria lovaniensis]|uniref:Uncharacterized protein n=1 Tax=Naegleria lovaniensis TaxID=51637 RepID=A0AA88KSB7_NAELO|nr:uncharacterized protein C9374_003791 [Naegleria lovaniensis]KAG2394027.1 hypothetical protein C9374_003791 [Naegleria lovaniensis]
MRCHQIVRGKLFCFHDRRNEVIVASDKQEIGLIEEEWLEWNGENDFVLSENFNLKQVYPSNCKTFRIFDLANVSLGLRQIFLLIINSTLELTLFVKVCGKLNEEWTKCLELKLSKFSLNSSCTIDLVGFDGPSFIIKQDSQLYWITDILTSTLQFEVMYLQLSNDETKNRIIFSGYAGMDTKFWYTVFSTNQNQFSVLKIPIDPSNGECSLEICASLGNSYPLPPSSYSSICTCLTYVNSEKSGVFGTLEKELLFFNADSITRCLKLSSIPVKLHYLHLNARPVHEEYILVHTSDRSLQIISLVDFSIVREIEKVYDFLVHDFFNVGTMQLLCIHTEYYYGKLHYTLIPNLNTTIINGIIHDELSERSIHLYSVMRALATQIENTNNHIKNLDNIKQDKQNLLRHQNRVTQEILIDFQKRCDDKYQNSTEQNNEIQPQDPSYGKGISVSFENNKSLENNLFYDHHVQDTTNVESMHSLSDTDITLKSASQALNTKYWDIRSCFITKNDMDVILLPISNHCPLQAEIFKKTEISNSSKCIHLTTRIETPLHYADDDFSVKCLLIKRKPNSEPLFEYMGVLQPSVTDKLFGLKQPIKSNFADIQTTQLIFIMKHDSVEKSLKNILSEIWVDRLCMTTTNNNDYEYCSSSKGYISPLFYKAMINYELTTCTESTLICDVLSDTIENMILVLTTIIDHLPENIIVIPSTFAENVLKHRKAVCVNINKEVNHVIFKMHDHVKQSTMMNPREHELQQDLLEYLSLQIETDQSMLNLLNALQYHH